MLNVNEYSNLQLIKPVHVGDAQIVTEDWGLIPYVEAVERQLRVVEDVAAGGPNRIIFCSHPPVVTLGRGTKPGDLTTWSGETIEVSRGGRATYHGPNQIVIYPVLNLARELMNKSEGKGNILPQRDVHAYLRLLEKAIVQTLKEFGVSAEVREVAANKDEPSMTGVWVGNKKIASIGIAVKKWVTYHGIALNFTRDEKAFVGINPCGFQSSVMTSLEEILPGPLPSQQEFQNCFKRFLTREL